MNNNIWYWWKWILKRIIKNWPKFFPRFLKRRKYNKPTENTSRFIHPCVTALTRSHPVGFLKLHGLKNSLPTNKTKTLGEILKISKSWLHFSSLYPTWIATSFEMILKSLKLLQLLTFEIILKSLKLLQLFQSFFIRKEPGQVLVTLVQISVNMMKNCCAIRDVTQGWIYHPLCLIDHSTFDTYSSKDH